MPCSLPHSVHSIGGLEVIAYTTWRFCTSKCILTVSRGISLIVRPLSTSRVSFSCCSLRRFGGRRGLCFSTLPLHSGFCLKMLDMPLGDARRYAGKEDQPCTLKSANNVQ